VFPVPAFVEETVTELFIVPAEVAVTLTENVQDEFAATVAALKLTSEEPAVALEVPPHVLLRLFGVATTRPLGRVSVNATPVRELLGLGFVITNVNDVEAPLRIWPAPKVFVIDGGPSTRIEAVANPVDVLFVLL